MESSAQTWTLNPLVADDGDFDADEDGLIDKQEFALAQVIQIMGFAPKRCSTTA